MLRAVPAGLHIQRVDPVRPAVAAEVVARRLEASAPSGRGRLLVTIARGTGPGLQLAPWTRAGLKLALGATGPGAADVASLALEVETASALAGGLAVSLAGGLAMSGRPARGEHVRLRWPGMARPLRVPLHWLGRSALFVTPCVIGRARSSPGPVATAFAAFAVATGATVGGGRSRELARVGERLAARIFAHVAVIVDASWSVIEGGPGDPRSWLPTGRCLGAWTRSPNTLQIAASAADCDRWLGSRLRLSRPTPAPVLAAIGDAAESPWPAASATPGALADRGVEALWRFAPLVRAERGHPSAAGRPGALGRAWEAWGPERST